jgi:LacI family transcriptional regulator
MKPKASGQKYLRIKNHILREIRQGLLKPGQRVASISEILRKHKVSKVTAVHALAALEADGIVRREHGRGTFVTDQSEAAILALDRKSVAVIVPDMQNPFNVEIVGAMENLLRKEGIVAELSCTDGRLDAEECAFERIRAENKASGIVLVSYATEGDLPEKCLPQIPIVTVDYCNPALSDRSVFVSCDNFKGGYDAAAHLIELGHRRIGMVRWGEVSSTRIEGFHEAMAEHGLDFADSHVFLAENHQSVGEGIFEFVKRERLTALFAINDMLAMQVMSQLHSNGMRIPRDISLVGYDNVMASAYLEVPLTTIEQYDEIIGRRAASAIISAIRDNVRVFTPREILIVPTLVVRDSTAPHLERTDDLMRDQMGNIV